jgi:hypothetical protein
LPNPNTGNFLLSFNAASTENYQLEVKNTAGETIYLEAVPASGSETAQRIDISKYGKGIYLVILKGPKTVAIKKMVIY